MPKKKVAVVGGDGRITPLHRYRWFDYVEEDAEEDDIPYRLRVRTNLSYGEYEQIRLDTEGKTADRDLWPIVAPFVVDWNVSGVNADGHEVDLPAPAEGGPEQFQYIPPQLFAAVYRDLMVRGTPPLARKTPSVSGSTPEASPEAT